MKPRFPVPTVSLLLVFIISVAGAFSATAAELATASPTTSPVISQPIMVLTPQGRPAVGATAILVPSDQEVTIVKGQKVEDDSGCQRIAVGEDGKIRLPAVADAGKLVVIHPEGYAEIDRRTAAKTGDIMLQAWGHVEGCLLAGQRPVANAEVAVWGEDGGQSDPHDPQVFHDFRMNTGPDGRFAFDHVPPGRWGIGRSVTWHLPGGGRVAGYTQKQTIFVRPGETLIANLGGIGRSVAGRFLLSPALTASKDWEFGACLASLHFQSPPLPMPEDVKTLPFPQRQQWYEHFLQTDAGKAYVSADWEARLGERMYPLDMSQDGAFRIEDVPAGRYELYATLAAKTASPDHKAGEEIASGKLSFTMPAMPDGRSDDPLQLPNVSVEMVDPIKAHTGKLAPDFSVNTMDGRPIKLSAFCGKHVLLIFWATWCGGCIAETDDLKAIFDQFSHDERLVMIGLSTDDLPYEPQRYIDQHKMAWTQCFIGPESSVAKDYGVGGIPSIWLIGPDGKVIRSVRRSDSVKEIIARKLAGH